MGEEASIGDPTEEIAESAAEAPPCSRVTMAPPALEKAGYSIPPISHTQILGTEVAGEIQRVLRPIPALDWVPRKTLLPPVLAGTRELVREVDMAQEIFTSRESLALLMGVSCTEFEDDMIERVEGEVDAVCADPNAAQRFGPAYKKIAYDLFLEKMRHKTGAAVCIGVRCRENLGGARPLTYAILPTAHFKDSDDSLEISTPPYPIIFTDLDKLPEYQRELIKVFTQKPGMVNKAELPKAMLPISNMMTAATDGENTKIRSYPHGEPQAAPGTSITITLEAVQKGGVYVFALDKGIEQLEKEMKAKNLPLFGREFLTMAISRQLQENRLLVPSLGNLINTRGTITRITLTAFGINSSAPEPSGQAGLCIKSAPVRKEKPAPFDDPATTVTEEALVELRFPLPSEKKHKGNPPNTRNWTCVA